MALLEELAAVSRPRKCSVAAALEALGAEAADLEAVITDDSTYSLRAIHAVLAARGMAVGKERLSLHRRGECPVCT